MKILNRTVVSSARLACAAVLALGIWGSASAQVREHQGGEDRGSISRGGDDDHGGFGGFGNHPSLPVPAALVFGGLAIAGVAGALHRRRKSRRDDAPKSE
jgi:hypothetical protein